MKFQNPSYIFALTDAHMVTQTDKLKSIYFISIYGIGHSVSVASFAIGFVSLV